MNYALVIKLNGRVIVLSIHPTFEAASAAQAASNFADAKVVNCP